MTDDDRSGGGSFTLIELAEVSGVPAHTIRFYITRGLLAPPLVGGRAACYGEEHLKELGRIKTLQGQGRTLAQIAWQLAEGERCPHRIKGRRNHQCGGNHVAVPHRRGRGKNSIADSTESSEVGHSDVNRPIGVHDRPV